MERNDHEEERCRQYQQRAGHQTPAARVALPTLPRHRDGWISSLMFTFSGIPPGSGGAASDAVCTGRCATVSRHLAVTGGRFSVSPRPCPVAGQI